MKQRLLLTLTAALLALSSWANGTEINGIYYILDSDTKTASVTYTGSGNLTNNPTSYNPEKLNYKGNDTIPATIIYNDEEYSVTSIGRYAFFGCSDLTGIIIPNTVTSIEDYAFRACPKLTSVTIPSSVTSIGANAFLNSTGLTSVTIPNSVASIGAAAFGGCSSLLSIDIPSSVTSIGGSAFNTCPNLTSITVDAGNTVYDSRENCNAIIRKEDNTLIAGCKNTIIPNSVTSIGGRAFYQCTSLTNISIPNSVTTIGISAFYRCTGLTNITIPNSVKSSRRVCVFSMHKPYECHAEQQPHC